MAKAGAAAGRSWPLPTESNLPAIDMRNELEHLRSDARAIAIRLLSLSSQVDDPIAEAVVAVGRNARALGRRTTMEQLRRPPGGCTLNPSSN